MDLDHFLSGNNLFQLINEPTRITATSQTILDLVITDSPGHCTSHFTLSPPANCDHNVIVAKFNLSVPWPRAYKRHIWNFNSVDVNLLTHSLSSFNWDDLFINIADMDSLYDTWFSMFTSIVKKFIQFREVTIHHVINPGWPAQSDAQCGNATSCYANFVHPTLKRTG